MELDWIETFLTLSEELHFGRTARRLHLSQPRVTRLIWSRSHENARIRALARTARRLGP